MARYTKKPVTIEAVRFVRLNPDNTPHFESEGPADWVADAVALPPTEPGAMFVRDGDLRIQTLEGSMLASPGDFIIRGIQGELYPCKPDIFAATYEPEAELVDLVSELPTKPTFAQDLCDLINRHSMENHSDTPDYILCEYLLASLKAFDVATVLRSRWYDRTTSGERLSNGPPLVFAEGFDRYTGRNPADLPLEGQ
jgi:hypothetical protein